MKVVAAGTVSTSYTIREHDMDDSEYKFDWVLSNGEESYELFDSAEAAIRDVEERGD